MSKAYCCDLCGELYSPVIERRRFRFIERVVDRSAKGIESEKGVDVCPACYEEFLDFVGSKRNYQPKETKETKEPEETEIVEEETKGGLL